ncbi:SLAM family member 7 isoform X1 [Halichoerus grypus]|uniref:SLAM family member 7 isoform X1 n=1 Tax=Halichoerus grypus TaxID=9711 RepID=UPI001659CECD|nr:SLAM family member 7 isoform X1 [Halichoerus grypus]
MLGPPACFILILLLCHLTGPATSGALKKLVGDLGGSVTFPLKLPGIQIDSLVWIFNTTPLITIQPKTPDKQANVIVTQSHNKERLDFLHGNYSLKLSKLDKSDSGDYRVVIYSSSLKDPFIQRYGLRVYEHLSKPKVIMGLQNNENGTCVTNLTCFMDQGGEDVTYSWESLGQTANESHNGPILSISWRLGKKGMTFICVARNPISSNSSNPIFAWKLCEGAADDSESSMVLYVLGVLFLFSVFALVPVILIMRRERKKEPIEEKKGKDTHQEVLNSYPSSGETPVYDTITYVNNIIPEENPVNTLYSSVQIPQKMEKPHSPPTSSDTPRLFPYENVI